MSPRATKSPAIVAELGRPETPEETAARVAENSRLYRARKTLNNLWFSLLACLAVLVLIVLIVPRSDKPREYNVDYASVAQGAQSVFAVPLAVPDLPEGWRSNGAEIRSVDDVESWYIGFLTPSDQYIGLTQAVNANPTWTADRLARSAATGTQRIDGVEWTVYDNTNSGRDDLGNAQYALTTESDTTTFLLIGTAPANEFETLAGSIAPTVRGQ